MIGSHSDKNIIRDQRPSKRLRSHLCQSPESKGLASLVETNSSQSMDNYMLKLTD